MNSEFSVVSEKYLPPWWSLHSLVFLVLGGHYSNFLLNSLALLNVLIVLVSGRESWAMKTLHDLWNSFIITRYADRYLFRYRNVEQNDRENNKNCSNKHRKGGNFSMMKVRETGGQNNRY